MAGGFLGLMSSACLLWDACIVLALVPAGWYLQFSFSCTLGFPLLQTDSAKAEGRFHTEPVCNTGDFTLLESNVME